MRFLVWINLTFLGFQMACASKIDDLKSETKQSNVPTTETGGIVTATINPGATAFVVASAEGALADTAVTIPAGSLAISTASAQVAVGPATDQSSAVAQALGFPTTAISDGTSPLFVGDISQNIALNSPLVLQLPLPITTSKLGLAAGRLALIYVIYTSTGYKAGIKLLTEASLRGVFIETEAAGFGFYRIVYLPTAVDNKEVQVSFIPSLQSSK